MRQRRLNEEEAALWTAFAQGIAPLRAARQATPDISPTVAATPAAGTDKHAPLTTPEQLQRLAAGNMHSVHGTPGHSVTVQKGRGGPFEIGVRRPGMDDTSSRGLFSGKLRPARRLDQHR
ncbi:MAG: DNA mismatch repair protein, partial [Komagataeibacter saccharivorans]